MLFQVCNRKTVVDTTRSCNDRHIKNIIISIADSDKHNVKFTNRHEIPYTKAILPLRFDDIDHPENGLIEISDKDALLIAKFVNIHSNDVDMIIVNCEAGQSRSAGCCAAIMKYLTGSDSDIFDNPRYTPNMLVYRTVLNALIESEEDM